MSNPLSTWTANWLRRHRNRASLCLHAVGIPACFAAAPILLCFRQWWAAGICFVGGYVLQIVGHVIEGNRSGEEMFLRRLLGRSESPGESEE